MPKNRDNWHAVETYKSLMQFSGGALKFVLLANGGAAIALLSFVGNLYSKGGMPPDIRLAMILFVIGIVLGGVATVTAYMTQLILYNETLGQLNQDGPRSHGFWLWLSIFLICLGVAVFGAGSLVATFALN